jgi:hypothetical protein
MICVVLGWPRLPIGTKMIIESGAKTMRICGNTVFYLLYLTTMKAKPALCMRSGSYILEKRPGFLNQDSWLSIPHNNAARASRAAAKEMPVLPAAPVYGTTVWFHIGR